jgi:hypothetical protein
VLVDTNEPTSGSHTGRLIIAWLWVGIPLAWGVSQTVIRSLDLFK